MKFKSRLLSILSLVLLLFVSISAPAQSSRNKKHVIIGYVGGYHGLYDITMVDAKKLTHINYAFVVIKNNRAYLEHEKTDTVNFRNLLKLKKINPDIKLLISIGGWGGSRNFSDAVLTDTAREGFAASAVAIVRKYKLDGVDIDWEYPNDIGAGNIYRPEDKHNYTLMFRKLRLDLDTLEKQTGSKKLLTTAVGGFTRFLTLTEMGDASKYLDYVSLMTYDFAQDSLHIVLHHTNLYSSKGYKTLCSADIAVHDFMAAGVPADKLVVGVAFYGHTLVAADSQKMILGARTAAIHVRGGGGGYTFIKDSLINQKGYKYYRDKDAGAPYLYNADLRQFITFDDEWSVKNKCRYVKKNGLAGVMFWEYASDKKEYLLKEIDKDLTF
ncbi:glycoside hydrolase family 18 protein [Mucilaginibacter sp.]|jgi:chitinase|uniref:glycoside hydrolase family 18 protein n=1 Tax=Mucilaginibacter sp. TaxID=1882438 RepID=UPI002B7F18B8|nr:glycoside hydrolase family 18 protein [Mucilaginibacter sp.]HTI61272.1 glycoside hydrolase family 18 protein [Mucilaginibacter sp.]